MSKYRIGPSRIHGQGLMAERSIVVGELIDVGIDYHLGIIPYITPHFGSWINHCQHANTKLTYLEGKYYIVATHLIKKGEEITVNYNQAPWYVNGPEPWYKN